MNSPLKNWFVWPFAAMLAVSAAANAADVFDKPLDKNVVKLPTDPDNPQNKPKRSCFYYPGFMAKEVDLGEVGAETLSVTPIAKGGQNPPAMRRTPARWSSTPRIGRATSKA